MQFYLFVCVMTSVIFLRRANIVLSFYIFLILSFFVIFNIKLSIDYNGYIEYFKCSIVESCSDILARRVEISYIYIYRNYFHL